MNRLTCSKVGLAFRYSANIIMMLTLVMIKQYNSHIHLKASKTIQMVITVHKCSVSRAIFLLSRVCLGIRAIHWSNKSHYSCILYRVEQFGRLRKLKFGRFS